MLKSGPRSARPRWLCMEQSTATFSLPTDVCWEPVPHFVVMSKLLVWPLTRTPAFKATRRSLAGAVRQTLFQWEADGVASKGRVAQMGFLSCRAQSRHLLLLVIVKMRDSSTSLGMTELGDPHVNRCRRFGQHAQKMRPRSHTT